MRGLLAGGGLFFVLNRRWRVNYGVDISGDLQEENTSGDLQEEDISGDLQKNTSSKDCDYFSSKRHTNAAHRVRPRQCRNIIHAAELLLLGPFGRTN